MAALDGMSANAVGRGPRALSVSINPPSSMAKAMVHFAEAGWSIACL